MDEPNKNDESTRSLIIEALKHAGLDSSEAENKKAIADLEARRPAQTECQLEWLKERLRLACKAVMTESEEWMNTRKMIASTRILTPVEAIGAITMGVKIGIRTNEEAATIINQLVGLLADVTIATTTVMKLEGEHKEGVCNCPKVFEMEWWTGSEF